MSSDGLQQLKVPVTLLANENHPVLRMERIHGALCLLEHDKIGVSPGDRRFPMPLHS